MEKIKSWIQEYDEYCSFLQLCEDERIYPNTENEAKKALKQQLEYVVCCNSKEDLNQREIEWCKQLHIALI